MSSAGRAARNASHEIAPWIEWMARIGYAALGLVYIIVGFLAAKAAIGEGGGTTDATGAFRVIREQPFGVALLWIVALGLFGYAAWRFIEAAKDPGGRGTGKRVMSAIKGVVHAALGLSAARLAMGDPSSSGNGFLASVAANPVGRWLMIAAGVVLAIYGIKKVVDAVKADIENQLDLSTVSSGSRSAIHKLARFGIGARGVVFAVVGFLIARAAWVGRNSEDQNSEDALDLLAGLPGGQYILGFVALGLIAYGIYSFVMARYKRIDAG